MFHKISLFVYCLLIFLSISTKAQESKPGRESDNGDFCAKHRIQSFKKQQTARKSYPEHVILMNKYDVKAYHLDIHLERTSTYISGNVTMTVKVVADMLDIFAFELHPNLAIDSVLIESTKFSFSRDYDRVSLILVNTFAKNQTVKAQIFYKGQPPYNNGINNTTSGTWGNQVTWTLSEPYGASEWFPCKQVLGDKADKVEVWVTTDVSNKVGSNGLLKNVRNLSNGKVRYEWESNYPTAYYLISVAVGKYIEYNLTANPVGASSPIFIQNYIYDNPNTLLSLKSEIDRSVPLLEYFSEIYGIYPFQNEKYGHCMAPFGGGMEHQTMTTQGTFTLTLTAHELAHQWFGNYVTCGSWKDIWINEGFASYSEYLALEKFEPSLKDSWLVNNQLNVMNSAGGSIYVNDTTNVNRIFSSRLTYDKGACILHTLRYLLNDDAVFFQTFRNFQAQFANKTAKGEDFKKVLENTSGKDFSDFFQQWYYGEGFPTYAIEWYQVGNQLIIKNKESVSQADKTPLFSTEVEYKITLEGQTPLFVRLSQDSLEKLHILNLSGKVLQIEADPNNCLINKALVIKNPALGTILGLEPEKKLYFRLYPNPSENELSIEIPDVNGAIETKLYDNTGKFLKEFTLKQKINSILLDKIPSGSYFLKFKSKELENIAHFIKR